MYDKSDSSLEYSSNMREDSKHRHSSRHDKEKDVLSDSSSSHSRSHSRNNERYRDNNEHKILAILPNCDADHEGIINFTTNGIVSGDKTYTAAKYCSRIAGILAGTPLTISATYAPLNELDDCERKTKTPRI